LVLGIEPNQDFTLKKIYYKIIYMKKKLKLNKKVISVLDIKETFRFKGGGSDLGCLDETMDDSRCITCGPGNEGSDQCPPGGGGGGTVPNSKQIRCGSWQALCPSFEGFTC